MTELVIVRTACIVLGCIATFACILAAAIGIYETKREFTKLKTSRMHATVAKAVRNLLISRLVLFVVCAMGVSASTALNFQYNDPDTCAWLVFLGPMLYVATKGCSYILFLMKSRLVRPLTRWSIFDKLLFITTLSVFAFAIIVAVMVEGRMAVDDEGNGFCMIWVPEALALVMAIADTGLSFGYVYLFLVPLRQLATGDHSSQYKSVIRKNFWVCVICVILTISFMAWIVTLNRASLPDYMVGTTGAWGQGELAISTWLIFWLTYKSSSTPQIPDERTHTKDTNQSSVLEHASTNVLAFSPETRKRPLALSPSELAHPTAEPAMPSTLTLPGQIVMDVAVEPMSQLGGTAAETQAADPVQLQSFSLPAAK